MASFHAVVSLLLPIFFCLAATTCYNPDGSDVTDLDFQPCVPTIGTVSMCCATNRTSKDTDRCISNGLCYDPCTTTGECGDTFIGEYWRESCTDRSWKSPFCLQGVCTVCSDRSAFRLKITDEGQDGGNFNGTAAMSQCATDGSWCCGGELTSDECCAMENRVSLAATIGLTSTSSTSTLSTPTYSISLSEPPSSSIPSPTTTSTLIPAASHSNTSKKVGLGAGIGIGIGIGTATGIVLIVAIIFAYFIFRYKNQNPRQNIPNRPDLGATLLADSGNPSINQYYELSAAAAPVSEVL